MNDRTKQPMGIRFSEKCVPLFRLQKWVHLFFNRATVVSRVLYLTLISFPKNATKRAVSECLAEVIFLKENKSTLLFPQRFALCFCVYVFHCYFSFLNMSKQPAEKNGPEKSLCNEFKLSRNSATASLRHKSNCSGVPDFLIRQETV